MYLKKKVIHTQLSCFLNAKNDAGIDKSDDIVDECIDTLA